ncbi:serine incorporator 5 [Pelobates cultripes]|uniref:Serine incorporator 5 n=1 Tax=Pelobates cultripes TaxID=61616 RepID=A0AAD1SHG5_PELCU|nr:serine incorporator 5 [Pelobates cultripes]
MSAGCCCRQVACCCGTAGCALCCACCPRIKQSTSTRIMYALFFILVTIVCGTMMSPTVAELMKDNIPYYKDICDHIQAGSACEKLVGYSAVYKVCFGMAGFFFILMLLTINIKNSRGCRAYIHNGFWFFKFLILIAMCSGAFFIPDQETFSNVWRYVGAFFGFIFLLIQLRLLVQFAHKWNKNWTSAQVHKTFWSAALAFVTLILYSVAVGALALLAYFYTHPEGCLLNKIFLGVNGGLCLLVTLVAFSPCVQKYKPHSGVLQSGIISCYVMYLTFSSLSSKPPETMIDDMGRNVTICVPSFSKDLNQDGRLVSIIGAIILFACILYSCLTSTTRASSDALIGRYSPPETEVARCCFCCASSEEDGVDDRVVKKGGQHVAYDEETTTVYRYWYFHFVFFLGTFYMMMTVTNWFHYNYAEIEKLFIGSWSPFWIKMASCWACILVYLWTLLFPVCRGTRKGYVV